MHNESNTRIVVPAATAILLTFGRGGMLQFEGNYTLLDQLMNIFVVVVAPIFALRGIFPRPANQNFPFLALIVLLVCWVSVCVLFGSPSEYWPPHSALITIGLSILLASQISLNEIRRVRHFVLLITAVFCLYTLLYGQASLSMILGGSFNRRLGVELGPGNAVAFPRIMYVLAFTCLVSLLIEKGLWVRIGTSIIMLIPVVIGLACGGRGALIAFVVALVTLLFGLRKRIEVLFAGIGVGLLLIIGYGLVVELLPLMEQRVLTMEDPTRVGYWEKVLTMDSLSLFGHGVDDAYPHNIFLEFLQYYGIVGLLLFLLLVTTTLVMVWRHYGRTSDIEVLWVIGLFVLQMTAQQFSLNIFTGALWAAIVLPSGFCWNRGQQFDIAVGNALNRSKSVQRLHWIDHSVKPAYFQ